MRRYVIIIAVLFMSVTLFAQDQADKDLIKQVIQLGYVDGLLNYGDTEPTHKSFHPDFYISGLKDNKLTKYHLKDWIPRVEKAKAEGKTPDVKFYVTFPIIKITEKAAMVQMDIFAKGSDKQVFTDYLLMYKFDEGWKIVQKIYHRFP
jgi:hypothetical protein